MEDIQKDIEDINNINEKLRQYYKDYRELKNKISELEKKREMKIDMMSKYYEYVDECIFVFESIKETELKHYCGVDKKHLKHIYIMAETEGYNIKIFVKDQLNNYVDISDKFVKIRPMIKNGYLSFKYINEEGKSFLPFISIFFI